MTTPAMILPAATLEIYRTLSSATLCTHLFKRGLRNIYIQGVSRLNAGPLTMAGQAFTLRYIPAREDTDPIEVFQDPNHPQRAAVEAVPPGQVLVMDCRGDASAASAGSILAKRMEVRGCAGIVTDGGLRDAEVIGASALPAFCSKPSAPTNLTKHHAVDLNVPIGCGGVPVYPGDVIVGDGDGVVVVPLGIAEEVAEIAAEMERFEAYVYDKVSAGASIVGLYPPNEKTRADYEAQTPPKTS